MKPELWISLASFVVALGSLVVSTVSSRRSAKIAARQTKVQERMLALEDVRQRAETRAMKRATVTGRIRRLGTDARLVVENAGPAPARDVRITLDSQPAA